MSKRQRLTAALMPMILALVLAACGSSTHAQVTPAARLIHTPGSPVSKIVLSALGAQRIGLTTATARPVSAPKHAKGKKAPAGGPRVIIPASAVIYDPSGKTYAFVSVGHLTYQEVQIVVDNMTATSAYLGSGPRAGATVVSRGAEELYGVQAGVLAQT